MAVKFRLPVAVHLLLVHDGKILLLRRQNTGYQDGNYSIVAGHIDGSETLKAATVREAKEEAGVELGQKDLVFKLVMHKREDDERMSFFFESKKWQGDITNTEPEKCDDLTWFPLDSLPPNTVPYVREAIRCYQNGITYSEFGWS